MRLGRTRDKPRLGRTFAVAAWLAAWFALVSAAAESPTTEARAAFDEGRYLPAAELAEALATADGLALAAEALAVYGHYVAPEDERLAVLERANRLAEQAVELEPTNAEARFQLAHAMARYAQGIGPVTALRQGFVGRSREAIEATLELDPNMPEARLSLASWHADVVGGAGGLLGRTLYGATVGAAIENYERTLELAPDEKIAYYEFGRALAAMGRRHRDRAREMLTRATELPARNHFDELIHERAVAELARLAR